MVEQILTHLQKIPAGLQCDLAILYEHLEKCSQILHNLSSLKSCLFSIRGEAELSEIHQTSNNLAL